MVPYSFLFLQSYSFSRGGQLYSSRPKSLLSAMANATPEDSSGAQAPIPATDDKSPAQKPIHSLVLDTGPLIKNEIAVSTLLAQAESLYTIPSVISEIRDENTRSRLQNTLVPFLTLRSPRAESVKFVSDFARKTGDLQVLSRPDLYLIALTYELECERNNGDWRLRREPAQRSLNGKPPAKEDTAAVENIVDDETSKPTISRAERDVTAEDPVSATAPSNKPEGVSQSDTINDIQTEVQDLSLGDVPETTEPPVAEEATSPEAAAGEEEDDGSDSDGWITPSNIRKHQARDDPTSAIPEPTQRTLQACLLTSDYAMQNVSLRMNLNCAGPSLRRITHLKAWVLRCHGCFTVVRQQGKQFCPSCGQPTLTRVACSTSADGSVRLHLKRNFQYNKRGNVYSIPKPVHGSASGKNPSGSVGGGKNGWGKELILAEDQKEYTKKVQEEKRTKYRDLMDDDYLPDLLTGHRSGGNGRFKVGAGRNVNSRRTR